MLLALPLSLSILYKRFTGGVGILPIHVEDSLYAPTSPPGLQNVGFLSVLANATIPFIGASSDDMPLPTFSDGAKPYGFNILLLSNTSAAALDGPVPNQVSQIQRELTPDTVSILTANVRATVVNYNSTVETYRNDTSFWEKYFPSENDDGHLDSLQLRPLGSMNLENYLYTVRAKNSPGDDEPWQWDHSWIFIALLEMPATAINRPNFQKHALGFDINRHSCQGTWRITRNSIDLLSGTCSEQPLPYEFQYLSNSFMTAALDSIIIQSAYLGRFAIYPSHWAIPTHIVTIASIFESAIASTNAFVHLQPEGALWNISNPSDNQDFRHNETYFVANTSLHHEVPIIKANAWLYIILCVQPLMVIIAILATVFLYDTPISRGFGLISVLAGVQPDGLDMLGGATLSGTAKKSITLTIKTSEKEVPSPRIFYFVGGNGKNSRVSRHKQYHWVII